MEEVTILKIGTEEAVKSVNDLRSNIKILKESLGELEIGTEQYQSTLDELKVNQNALKDAMYATSSSMTDVAAAAAGASKSYNSLVHQMAALKEEWRATNDEARRNELGAQIGEINQRLKDMDASVGNFQRNVGNYSSVLDKLGDGFLATAGGAGKVINPLKGVTTGFKALSATPVIGILGLLANIINKVIEGLDSSEENARAAAESFSVFSVVGDAVTLILQGISDAITAVGNGFTWLMEKLGLVSEEMKVKQEIAKEETRLLKLERDNIYKNADAELQLAKLKNQAADKNKYSAQERIALLEQAAKVEEDTAKRALEAAELEYKIIKQKNSLTESSTEDLNKEAEAYAALVKAETAYYTKTKELTTQISEAKTAAAKEAQAAAKALYDAEIKLLEATLQSATKASEERYDIEKTLLEKRYKQEVKVAKNSIKDKKTLHKTLLALEKTYHADILRLDEENAKNRLDVERQHRMNVLSLYTTGTIEYLRTQVTFLKWEMDNLVKASDETDAAFKARQLESQRKYSEAVEALNNKIVDNTKITKENLIKEAKEGSEAQLQMIVKLREYELNSLQQQIGESDAEFRSRQLDAQKAYNKAAQDLVDLQTENERIALENKMTLSRDNQLEFLKNQMELKQFELNALHQLEGESDAAFKARQLEKEQEYIDAKRALAAEQVGIAQEVASGVSGLLTSLADAYESDTNASEKELKRARNLRIAAATIDMLSGAVAAFTAAQTIAPPYGQIIGATNAAAVIAMGVANINKIKSTSISKDAASSNASTSAVVNPPSIDTNIPTFKTATSASEEDRLNRMASPQKVYILQSDIEAAGSQSKVQIEESSF